MLLRLFYEKSRKLMYLCHYLSDKENAQWFMVVATSFHIWTLRVGSKECRVQVPLLVFSWFAPIRGTVSVNGCHCHSISFSRCLMQMSFTQLPFHHHHDCCCCVYLRGAPFLTTFLSLQEADHVKNEFLWTVEQVHFLH